MDTGNAGLKLQPLNKGEVCVAGNLRQFMASVESKAKSEGPLASGKGA